MRLLWLSQNPGLYDSSGISGGPYNGGGWISSLQRLFVEDKDVELALAFGSSQLMKFKKEGNFTYYPILHTQSRWQRIREYYGGYKHPDITSYVTDVQKIVNDFKPDVIHVFGLENQLANALGRINIPMVVHIQGLIIPYANAFWPAGFSKRDFQLRPSKREWLLRNGFVYSYNSITARAGRERKLFGRLEYAMGRTQWDKNVTELFAPKAKYYHVNEVLRPVFYEHQGEWRPHTDNRFIIISVISETIYKGLDLVMKTAHLLKTLGFQFEWNVVGIKPTDRIVGMFEKALCINSKDVNIRYCGVKTAEELCADALTSSLYVHPSYIDNSPNSLCEAQLLGMPIIAVNVGGVPTLLSECETLQLVPSNGVYELAHSIMMIKKNNELTAIISRAGYEIARKRHDRKEIKKTLIATYQSVIKDYQEKRNV